MAVESFEDIWELEAPSVEALPPDPDRLTPNYPWPDLAPSRGHARRNFRVVVLQNAFTKLGVCPDLGGRIVEVLDRRTGLAVVPRASVAELAGGGPRGVWLPVGIEIVAGGVPRANSMGPVDCQLREDEEGPTVVMHELSPGECLSWHATVSLPRDRAWFEIRFRMLNRGLAPTKASTGIILPAPNCTRVLDQVVMFDSELDAGLAVSMAPGGFEHWEGLGHASGALLASSARMIGPRDIVAWSAVFAPFSGVGQPIAAGPAGAIGFRDGCLLVQGGEPLEGTRLIVRSQTGSFEATVALAPGETARLPVGDVGLPQSGSLRSGDGIDRLVWREEERPRTLVEAPPPSLTVWDAPMGPESVESGYLRATLGTSSDPGSDLKRALASPLVRAPALVALAMRDVAAGRHRDAADLLEEALLSNAQDHLAWWLRAVALRLAGKVDEDTPDLLNAHYLAPMEPALRAESLLGQPLFEGDGPNPILAPVEGNPEALVEVACLYLEVGLHEQAARWIDEALRLHDLPILRYMLAWSYLSGTRMQAEAAEQVRRARGESVGPPYPWRKLEAQAIRGLAERFPGETRLEGYRRLVDAAGI